MEPIAMMWMRRGVSPSAQRALTIVTLALLFLLPTASVVRRSEHGFARSIREMVNEKERDRDATALLVAGFLNKVLSLQRCRLTCLLSPPGLE
jgi:hypothetical protein